MNKREFTEAIDKASKFVLEAQSKKYLIGTREYPYIVVYNQDEIESTLKQYYKMEEDGVVLFDSGEYVKFIKSDLMPKDQFYMTDPYIPELELPITQFDNYLKQ